MAFLGLHLIIMSSLVLISEPRPECTINTECPSNKACIDEVCIDPCQTPNMCGINAYCAVHENMPKCFCREGTIGDPKIFCYKLPIEPQPECNINADCPSSETCINHVCKNPCQEIPDICGINAECVVRRNLMQCTCTPGLVGNPLTYCYKPQCRRPSDCPTSRVCFERRCV